MIDPLSTCLAVWRRIHNCIEMPPTPLHIACTNNAIPLLGKGRRACTQLIIMSDTSLQVAMYKCLYFNNLTELHVSAGVYVGRFIFHCLSKRWTNRRRSYQEQTIFWATYVYLRLRKILGKLRFYIELRHKCGVIMITLLIQLAKSYQAIHFF